MKIILKVLKFIAYTLLAVVLVLALFVLSLFFREQSIPKAIIEKIESAIESDALSVKVGSASFSLRNGLVLRRVRVYDPSRPDSFARPIATARYASVDWFGRKIRVAGASYPRLPDSYYLPRTEPYVPKPVEVELPEGIPEFDVVLENCDILGVRPERATAALTVKPDAIIVEDIRLLMPDRDRRLELAGALTVDFSRQILSAKVSGQVKHSHIAPIVEAYDGLVALPYIEACTGVERPIPAELSIDFSFPEEKVELKIDFSPKDFAYNGVQFESADASLRLAGRPEGMDTLYDFRFGVTKGLARGGRTLDGWIDVTNEGGPERISYGAKSTLPFKDLFNVVGELDAAWFEGLEFETEPTVSILGTNSVELADYAINDMNADVSVERANLMGSSVRDVTAEISLKGDELSISNVRSTGLSGGKTVADLKFFLKGFRGKGGERFLVNSTYTGGSLDEVAELVQFDRGARRGTVSGNVSLSGVLGDDMLASLCGTGRVEVVDGLVYQMKIFAGLTDWISKNVPGVSFLTEQTSASASFTIEDGLLETDDVKVGGGLISLVGKGKYSLPHDRLDFRGELELVSGDSIAGRFIKPITSPFTDLLMKFRVTGSLDDPKWKYSDAPIPGTGIIKSATGWLFDWSEDDESDEP